MKYFLTITLTLFSFILVAQSGTTLDEYRYLSKGYAYQLELGLDPTKNDYEIRKIYTTTNQANIIALYKVSDQKLKGLLLEVVDEKEKPHYWVVPNPQSDRKVLQMYEQDLRQYQHKQVYFKMLKAKDEYLFSLSTNRPVNHEAVPTYSNNYSPSKGEQFTTKGGTPLSEEQSSRSQLPTTYATSNTAPSDLRGKTITGQLNAELKSRRILVVPYAQNTSSGKGKVMVKFCADSAGAVTYAKFTQRGSTTLDAELKALAVAAVRKMRLAPSNSKEACGTVGFDF